MGHPLSKTRQLVLLFAIIGVFLFILPWGKALYRTAYIVSHVVPNAPRWFEWGRYGVDLREEEFVGSNPESKKRLVYVYLPQGVKKSSFVILVPGFSPEGAKDKRLVNLARSFGGAGIGVAVPDSDTIPKRVFSREDIDIIKDTFSLLQEKEYVDPERIGICGFSVAGSYVLRAASELGDAPLFVFSLGGYFDLKELIAEVLSKRAVYRGFKRSWEPNPLPREVVRNILVEYIGKENAEQLINKNPTFDDAKKYVQSLPKELLSAFNSLSPSPTLLNMRTRVFLMHDKNDDIIPVEESIKIRDALPEGIPVSFSEFSNIHHVTPKNFFSTDIMKFSWQVLSMVRILL